MPSCTQVQIHNHALQPTLVPRAADDRRYKKREIYGKLEKTKGHLSLIFGPLFLSLAEVDVELLEDETGWFPYLSVEDAYKLDDVRDALRRGDLESASKYGRVFKLRPVAHR